MDGKTREAVRRRAGNLCEYCHLPQSATPLITFHVEHIHASQHRHDDSFENLALACDRCNAFKGPNLSSIDPQSSEIVPLFHPRRDRWALHFRFNVATIEPLTPIGRATTALLQMNAPQRVELREQWLQEGESFS
jgi:putative hemolysin